MRPFLFCAIPLNAIATTHARALLCLTSEVVFFETADILKGLGVHVLVLPRSSPFDKENQRLLTYLRASFQPSAVFPSLITLRSHC